MRRSKLKEQKPHRQAAPKLLACRSEVLTPELINKFCALIKRGLPADGVCDYLGINNTTYYTWVRKGERHEQLPEEERDPGQEMYGQFLLAFKRATAEYRLSLVTNLHKQKNANWYQSMAILERRDRKTFGRHEQAGGSQQDYDPDERFL